MLSSLRILEIAFVLALLALPGFSQKKGLNKPAAPEARPQIEAPEIEATTVSGDEFKLSEATNDGYVLLVFIRGMW